MDRLRAILIASMATALLDAGAMAQSYHDNGGVQGGAGGTTITGVVVVDPGPPYGDGTGPLFTSINPGFISGSLGSFTPTVSGSRMTALPVGTGDSSQALPAGAGANKVLVVDNVGATVAYCNEVGASATASDKAIQPSSWFTFGLTASPPPLHCISTGSGTTINGVVGTGLPAGAGGGGGSSGAVTQGTSPWVDNISQFGGNAVVTGTGAGGVGVPRVTVSSDSSVTANAGTNLNTSALALETGGNLAGINGKLTTTASGLKVDGSAVTQPVSGAFWQTTQPVSLSSLPALSAGAAVIGAVTESGSWSVTANAGTNLNTSALATDAHLTALGTTSLATDAHLTALGTGALATDSHMTAQTSAIQALGTGALATDSHMTAQTTAIQALGTGALATDAHLTALGTSALATDAHLTTLGTSALGTDAHLTATQSTTGAAVPASARYLGMNVGGNLTGVAGTANGLKVDGSAVTQPVSVASLPLPASAATLAGQGTINADAGVQSHVMNFPATQAVSAASLPLASNAAQESGGNLAAAVSDLAQVVTNTTSNDPCNYAVKSNFAVASASGNIQIVAGSGTKRVYVCRYKIIGQAAWIGNLIEGTGAACITANEAAVEGSTTAGSGESFPIQGGFDDGNGGASVAQTATAGNGLCILQSGTAALAGNVMYVQQ